MKLIAFAAQLHFLKLAQRAQTHVEDSFGLPVSKLEFFHHHRLGFVFGTDNLNDPVEVQIGDDIALDQLKPRVDFFQPVLRTAHQHLDLVRQPFTQYFTQTHNLGHAIGIEDVHVQTETRFQIGQPEQRVFQVFRIDITAFGNEHDADFGIGFIAHIVEDRQLFVSNQLCDLLDQLALLHLVRNFGDHQLPGSARQSFYTRFAIRCVLCISGMETGPHAQGAATGFISCAYGFPAVDQNTASCKVGPLHNLHQLLMCRLGFIDQQHRGVDDFCRVVRGNAGRHAHRDSARAVSEEVWEKTGHDFRFFILTIIGRAEVGRIFVEPRHQFDGGLGQSCFGITICRGVIAVDITKISLPVDQRISQRKGLCEADHRIIDRLVAMRVVLTDYVTDDARALLISTCRVKLQLSHRPQQAAVHRFQAITQIGERPGGDGRHRIDQITFRNRRIERRIHDLVERIFRRGIGVGGISHPCPDSDARTLRKAPCAAIHSYLSLRMKSCCVAIMTQQRHKICENVADSGQTFS